MSVFFFFLDMADSDSVKEREASLAAQSLNSAEECYNQQNYSRAFAHYLLVLKLNPDKKADNAVSAKMVHRNDAIRAT